MIRFAVLSTNGQTIDFVGECEEETLSLQGDSQTALECPVGVEPDTHYYYNNAFVEYPTKPSEYATWNTATRTWTTPSNATIETYFEGAEYTVSGATFTTNTTAKTITVSSGTATRKKGVYSESKSFTAATLSYVDANLPAFIFYNWNNNSLQVVYDFSSKRNDSKSVLIANFDGTTLKNTIETPAIDGDKIVDTTVIRSKIAAGAVSEQAAYSVWNGYNMNQVTSVVDEYNFFTDEVFYYIKDGSDAESRLILSPEFYGATNYVTVNRPAVNGNRFARFNISFTFYKWTWVNGTLTNKTQIADRGALLNRFNWTDQKLTACLGTDASSSLVPDITFNLNTDYTAGQAISMRVGYWSYSTSPADCSVTRNVPGFGFTWKAFWK